MPTRSIKLKIVVPRKQDTESTALRRDLWTTHRYVNEAVAYYEELLLEMRQDDVLLHRDGAETLVPAAEWSERLRNRLAGRHLEHGAIEKALVAFKELYREVIPSAVAGKEGNAQAANAFVSPLLGDGSNGGVANNAAYGHWLPLLGHSTAPPEQLLDFAATLATTLPAEAWTFSGSPPGWLKLYKASPSTPGWALKLVAKLGELNIEEDGQATTAQATLRQLAALPLAPPLQQGAHRCRSTWRRRQVRPESLRARRRPPEFMGVVGLSSSGPTCGSRGQGPLARDVARSVSPRGDRASADL